jgi:hypothetical protein
MIAYLDILDEVADSNNNTSTFMSSDKRKLGIKGPIALPGVEVRVANFGQLLAH